MSTDVDNDGPQAFPSRRETILSLVEMLLQHPGSSGDLSPNQQPSFEDDKDVPSVDEHRQAAGAASFHRFQSRIEALDKQLRNFANATRQLGSSVAIQSSAFHLRDRIAQMLFLYHENAADLFPRKITHSIRENVVDPKIKGRRKTKGPKTYHAPPHVVRPKIDENLDLEKLPEQFEALANNIVTFGRCLNEFPEFTDDAINASITSFEGDLRYWASCLRVYHGQFRYPAVQRYVHDLAAEMGQHIDSITSTLVMFVEVGVPTIRFGQRHKTDNLCASLNLSTIATFFSAVTATTLQFSFNETGTPVKDAVNSFWFASLVFSIAAAVNSLLGLTWKQAMYRSPGHLVPWWVLIWIKRSPLVFLVMSVACFSVGLCLFAYASNQSPVTSAITTVFTAFTSFGLAAVSTWFASERYIYLQHNGKKWLSDALEDVTERFLAIPGVDRTRRIFRGLKKRLRAGKRAVARITSNTVQFITRDSDSEKSYDPEAILPISNGHTREASVSAMTSVTHLPEATPTASPSPEPAPNTPTLSSLSTTVGSEATAAPATPGPSRGKLLWKNALQTVKMRTVAATPFGPRTPHRQRTSSSNTNFGDRKRTLADEPIKAVLARTRITTLRPKLNDLKPREALEAHQALVRHLQFSPDGKFLATSSWDRTSIIWRIDRGTLTSHRVLAHAQGFVGQVAWSDTGNMLLTKLIRGVKVWSEVGWTETFIRRDGVCQKTIDRQTNVESITWWPGSQAFLSVEGNNVTKLDLRGKILDEYDFGMMKLHDVAVTPDGTRLLGVGPLLESPSGLHPSKSPAEKRLVVYNTELKQIEHQTPVLNDVRDVTLARNTRQGLVALVSYENKAPPQLWRMEFVKDRENAALQVARLTLRHTYMPKRAVEFAGPSYFGGKDDELVLCASKAGDIHIWDQESGTLLRYIRPAQQSGDMTCIAWNHAAEDPFMFATGSHDGGVRIWTKPEERAENEGDGGPSMVRSSSPFDMERTDSPLTQTEFEAVDALRRQESSTAAGGPSTATAKERIVTFDQQPES
ncbi:Catabolite degradation [Mycena sanguinolenta]|uniref:Catabolite degradation n=1 Tax=Mycena sanguinolenta TaxID=230812 RepID=A0A8H7CQF8_9AGAR|nr:Catabolite degradation [Mycena sanguinolenta]